MPQGFSDAWHGTLLQPELPDGSGATALFPSTGPHGHRKRMRERLLSRGGATIADYEVLEMLLFLGIPRIDTKPLAKATINLFGGLPAVLRASRASILSSPGLTPKCADAISLVQDTCPALAAGEARTAPVLGNWQALRTYLADATPAALRILYLDNKNRLLADEGCDPATLDAAARRVILRRALELHGVSLLLAAWRTDVASTGADREGLRQLRAAGSAVAVGVHDLVLVGNGDLISVQQDL